MDVELQTHIEREWRKLKLVKKSWKKITKVTNPIIEDENPRGELIGRGSSNVGNGIGIGIGGGIGVDEDERAIVGLVAIVVVEVGGAEIDAGATFKGSEESGGHVGADPIGRPV